MSGFRLDEGGRVDRAAPLTFTFDGRRLSGYRGDTLASALLANGVHLVGRSFKYHRPRGILAAGAEEPNALIQVERGGARTEPNIRATQLDLYDGLQVASQNRWPSLQRDIGAVNDVANKLFPSGFYYKTFMWPRSFWERLYEPFIRAAAGLGRAPDAGDPDTYASRYAHCDVLVVGAGAAGIAAALSASATGARVMLVDEQAGIGGWLLAEPSARMDGEAPDAWLEHARAELASRNVVVLSRTTAIGHYHDNFVVLSERLSDHLANPGEGMPRERLWRVRAGQVVLAQGALERPLVFGGNDRPGVMLAGAARTYLHRYGVRVGDRVVVVTSDDSAYGAALELAATETVVSAIIDVRDHPPTEVVERARHAGVEVLAGWTVTETQGRQRVHLVKAEPLAGGPSRTFHCDAVLMSGGWTPSVHLYSHARGKVAWRDDLGAFVPGEPVAGVRTAGAGNGSFALADAVAEAAEAGAAAATNAGFASDPASFAVEAGDHAAFGSRLVEPAATARRGRAFVDFQNDVTAKDIGLAVREGYRSIEHVKRYTTTGMATDQGKTSNINALALAAGALGSDIPAVGLTTFRPPYTPTTFGAIAGNHADETFDVQRKTAIDSWAEENGAVFEPVGQWRRARHFPQAGEDMDAAVRRECRATRTTAGMFDGSTLGKIEVIGPDAAEFIHRLYTNPILKLGVGRCRYGIMLGEDGFIRDDGVIGRLADDHFHVTTTTGGAASVMASLEDYTQTEWPDLDVWLTSITEQWAVIGVTGPKAREIIAPLIDDIDLSPDAFPHMSVREGHLRGMPTRLFRISFSGELGFEINVPSRFGRAVWEAVLEAGEPHGVCPYGTEAIHVLRAEKGFIITGQDTDGTVTPRDAGLEWAIGKKKTDFVGMRSLSRPDMLADGRKQLVGLLTDEPSVVLEEGAQIVADRNIEPPCVPIGHVTSAYYSDAAGRSIALALVEDGRGRMGDTLHVPMPDRTIPVKVTDTVFYDPEGERLHD